jgi:nitroreductase
MLRDLVRKSRSVRRFDQQLELSAEELQQLVETVRYCPSGANRQPLRYLLVHERALVERVFPCLLWASQLRDWPGPQPGEHPAAYVVIVGDTAVSKSFGVDHGIAAQTLMLAAAERGLGACILGALKRQPLRAALRLDARYEILLVLALGRAAETVVIDELPDTGDTSYYRDEMGRHHVPKRRVADLILQPSAGSLA